MIAPYSPATNPAFECTIRGGFNDRPSADIHPTVWREMRLRGSVPVVIATPNGTTSAIAAKMGEHYTSLINIRQTAEEMGFHQYNDSTAWLTIDWAQVLPASIVERIDQDKNFAQLWRSLTFERACELLNSVRKKRSPSSIKLETQKLIRIVLSGHQ